MKIATKENKEKDTLHIEIDFEDSTTINTVMSHLVAINEVVLGKVCEVAAEDKIMSKEFLTKGAYTRFAELIMEKAAAIQLPQEKIDG